MSENNELNEIAMQIISNVGAARSCYIEAISLAKEDKYDEAYKLIEDGKELFNEGHKAHFSLIQKEANGESVLPNLLLMHAEDQLMSAEGFAILANEFIDVYQKMGKKD